MKMTLPFKPHVLALICSAGLCAASTGVLIHLKYEKNREDIGLFGIWRD